MKKLLVLLSLILSVLNVQAGIWDGIKHAAEEDAWCIKHGLSCEACPDNDTSLFCQECREKCDRGD